MRLVDRFERDQSERFGRSWNTLRIVAGLHHQPLEQRKNARPSLFWVGATLFALALLGLLDLILSLAIEWPHPKVDEPPAGFLFFGLVLLMILGEALLLLNMSATRLQLLSRAAEIHAVWGRKVVWGVAIVAALATITFSVLAILGPWGLADLFRVEPGFDIGQARWVVVAMLVAAGISLWMAAWPAMLLSTLPIVTMQYKGRSYARRQASWGYLLLGIVGASFAFAVVRIGLTLFTDAPPIAALVTLGIAVLSVAFALAGRHSTEMRVRRAQAVGLLDGLAAGLHRNAKPRRFREAVESAERESRFPHGGWWWFPDPELFDPELLDLFSERLRDDSKPRAGIMRLRKALPAEYSDEDLHDVIKDLRDEAMQVPRLMRFRRIAEYGGASHSDFCVGDAIHHERLGEGRVTKLTHHRKIGDVAHVAFLEVPRHVGRG